MIKLIEKLEHKNIGISLNGNDLELDYDDQEIDQEIINEIRANRQELIVFLKKYLDINNDIEIQSVANNINYKVSHSQKRLWILSQFEKSSVAYNMPNSITLDGEYDIDSFEKAVNYVIKRHEILRTVFKEDDEGELKQWVLPTAELGFNIKYKDFRDHEDSKRSAQEYVQKDAYVPFDLENGPLLRACLLQISDDSYMFYYNMHHIISDAWSMDVLINDIISCYNSYKSGFIPELPELKIQYKDYAAWQSNKLDTQESKDSQEYWLNSLSGELPLVELPTSKLRPKFVTHNGRHLRTFIAGKTTQKLKEFCRNNGGSLFMGLLAVWKVLMHKYTSKNDIIVGTSVAGRDNTSLEDQIGFYVNTLALRNYVNSEESFRSFYKVIKESTLSAFSNQMYPFDKLVEELGIIRDPSRNPLFDTMFTLQNVRERGQENLTLDEKSIQEIQDRGTTHSKFDLDIDFYEIGEYLSFNINYNTDVYDSVMVEGLMVHYKELLVSLMGCFEKPLKDVEYLPSAERLELLSGFNATDVA
ncbi:condensation domain-containing protein, partial [Aquimarina litoralis]|uniref:condensation domain-containing protein n=1 Tax=Aquimarina litoralis TaxID=584605 RepID=UPI0031D5BC1C